MQTLQGYTLIEDYKGCPIQLRNEGEGRRLFRVNLNERLYTYGVSVEDCREIVERYRLSPDGRFMRVSGFWATPEFVARLIDLSEALQGSQSDVFHQALAFYAQETRINHE